jgi:hypothetical protein
MKRELIAGEILKLKDANDEIAQTYVFALCNFETDEFGTAALVLPVSFEVGLATHNDLVFGKGNVNGNSCNDSGNIQKYTEDEVDGTRRFESKRRAVQQIINMHFRAFRAPYDETISSGAIRKVNDENYGVFYDYKIWLQKTYT